MFLVMVGVAIAVVMVVGVASCGGMLVWDLSWIWPGSQVSRSRDPGEVPFVVINF